MIEFDEFSKPAMGGTEIIKYELQKKTSTRDSKQIPNHLR